MYTYTFFLNDYGLVCSKDDVTKIVALENGKRVFIDEEEIVSKMAKTDFFNIVNHSIEDKFEIMLGFSLKVEYDE